MTPPRPQGPFPMVSPGVLQGSFCGGGPQILRSVGRGPSPRSNPPHGATALARKGTGARPTPPPSAVLQPSGNRAFSLPPAFRLRPAGTGQPLPASVQARMESVLGSDLSGVRVHVGPEAASIGALAFTVGSDLYFAPGQYNPSSRSGLSLIGHELAHVLQQRSGRVRNPFGSGLAVVQDIGLEVEAERLGQRAAAVAVPPLQAKLAQLPPGAGLIGPGAAGARPQVAGGPRPAPSAIASGRGARPSPGPALVPRPPLQRSPSRGLRPAAGTGGMGRAMTVPAPAPIRARAIQGWKGSLPAGRGPYPASRAGARPGPGVLQPRGFLSKLFDRCFGRVGGEAEPDESRQELIQGPVPPSRHQGPRVEVREGHWKVMRDGETAHFGVVTSCIAVHVKSTGGEVVVYHWPFGSWSQERIAPFEAGLKEIACSLARDIVSIKLFRRPSASTHCSELKLKLAAAYLRDNGDKIAITPVPEDDAMILTFDGALAHV